MACASVNSLMRTMESVFHSKSPMQSLICDHREEFLALREKISSLEVFLKKFEEGNNSEEMIHLEARIKDVANVVEHVIRLRLAESLRANDEMQKKEAYERLCHSLQQVAEEIDHVYRESTKFQDKGKQASKKPLVRYSSSRKDIPDVNKNNMVGRDKERERLLKDLTRCYSGEVEVISIVGMGGIGKTTLAKEIYNDASIRSHFDVCAWATVSQQHDVKEILLSLLHSTKGDTFNKEDDSELADMLRKSLIGKRYLIVMDDMWSSKAWDDVRQCFPSQNNASRILLTTRNNTEVARYASTDNHSLQMDFMDSDDGWNLFKSAAFSNETLPSELESIGKKIVEKCQGLPLTIVVVAGLLFHSKRTTEVWNNVAENVMSFVAKDPHEQCLDVLGLSYNHLPGDLKACLLYFGVFPEDSEVSAKRLVRLWMAEGFLKFENDLEVEAEKCLQDLINRCLVLVCKKSRDETKIKSCKVHDIIYEMCLRNAQSQNFFIMKDFDSYRAVLTPGQHHLIRGQADDDEDNLLKRTHSIFSFDRYSVFLNSEVLHFNLLRVLDLSCTEISSFPPEILSLIWLRYLALCMFYSECIPPEICRLSNLQTLIVKHTFEEENCLTEQIWELSHLRHLRLNNFCLPNPPSVSVEEERYLGFPNVHTIQGLSPSSCTKEVISGIQNVKKLGIKGKREDYESFQEYKLFNNLVHLHQLETLSFTSENFVFQVTIPSAKAFPATLKKLKLQGTDLSWEDLNIIGELPNLEVLKLLSNSCTGDEWHPIAGGFTQLKLLLISRCYLKCWKATNDNFPVLKLLFIEYCSNLVEIPIEFAEIQSLQLIKLDGCSPKLKASAKGIQREQEDLGNNPIHVRFDGEVVIPADDDDEEGEEEEGEDLGDVIGATVGAAVGAVGAVFIGAAVIGVVGAVSAAFGWVGDTVATPDDDDVSD